MRSKLAVLNGARFWMASARPAILSLVILLGLILSFRANSAFGYGIAWVICLFVFGCVLERRHSFYGYLIFSSLLFFTKLALVAGNEIIAEHSDAWSYVAAASETPGAAIGPNPGYPAWLWLSKLIGFPQRISIEILFGFSAVIFSLAVGRFVFGFVGYSFVLLITLFSPVSYFLFDRALSDGFYISLSLFAVGFSLFILQTQKEDLRWLALIALGGTLGSMALTRAEAPLLAAAIFFLALFSVVILRISDKLSLGKAILTTFLRLGVTSAVAVSMVIGVSFIHWSLEGVWGVNVSALPSHSKLLQNLAAIKVTAPHKRFIPISREARLLAYQYSPTLNNLSAIIESPDNPYKKESQRVLGQPGEVGAGWIWHIFNDAAAKYGIRKAIELDRFYDKANSELDAAFSSGKLNRAFVLHSLLGADSSVWLPFLWDSLGNVSDSVTRALESQPNVEFDPELFDRICLRRKSLIKKGEGLIKGWAFSEQRGITRITVEAVEANNAESDKAHSFEAFPIARPDLQLEFKKQGKNIPLDTGFTTKIPLSMSDAIRVNFLLDDGQTVTADRPEKDRVKVISAPRDGTKVIFAIDVLPIDSMEVQSKWRNEIMQTSLGIYWSRLFWAICLIFAGVGISYLFRSARTGDRRALVGLVGTLLIGSWIVCRLGFYTVIDAAAWGAEPRYMLVIGMFQVALAALGILALAKRR